MKNSVLPDFLVYISQILFWFEYLCILIKLEIIIITLNEINKIVFDFSLVILDYFVHRYTNFIKLKILLELIYSNCVP